MCTYVCIKWRANEKFMRVYVYVYTHCVGSQVDHPEEIDIRAAASDEHARHVFAAIEKGGITVGHQGNEQLSATVVPQLDGILPLPRAR